MNRPEPNNAMRRRNLGPEGPPVGVIGFGAMRLSLADRPSEAEAVRVVHAALDEGVTLIDTADVYCLNDHDIGHNERLLARALSTWSGDRAAIVLASKGGLTRPGGRWVENGRPDHLRSACERSLSALRVERIELYQLHAPDPRVPFADSLGALARLLEEGKIGAVGLSNVSAAEIDQARGLVPIATVQNRLSPFFREAIANGLLAYCEELGLGFIAYSPVGGGRLNRRLPSHPAVGRIAAARGTSAHSVVLAWVLSCASNVIAIPSARKVEHAVDSARAAELELSPGEQRTIDEAEFPPE